MQSDQWAKVKEVLSAALELEPSERAKFVKDACGAVGMLSDLHFIQ